MGGGFFFLLTTERNPRVKRSSHFFNQGSCDTTCFLLLLPFAERGCGCLVGFFGICVNSEIKGFQLCLIVDGIRKLYLHPPQLAKEIEFFLFDGDSLTFWEV